MATFSYQFPRAVHVLPLHALKGILEERALLAGRRVDELLLGTEQRRVPGQLEDRIRRRAYELYVQRGNQSGSALDDWLQAEEEIRQLADAIARSTWLDDV